jgi:hypothetical protein
MKSLNARQLQQTFGLPFKTAELIVHQQMTLARRRYRHAYTLVWIGGAIVIVCSFLGMPWGMWGVLPLTCLVTSVLAFLIRKTAREPILAAARAAATTGHTSTGTPTRTPVPYQDARHASVFATDTRKAP